MFTLRKKFIRITCIVLASIFLCSYVMIAQGSVVKAYDIKGDGSIENYVRGLYFQLLNREPDQAGFDSWIDGYYYGGYTASDIARGFFFSPEYTTESRIMPSTNRQFVWDCYVALLGRGPSKGELDKYVDYINRGIPFLFFVK